MKNTLDQLTILAQQLISELSKERAEIEALKTLVQTREEEVVRRNAQLIAERTNVLTQVQSIRDEKESNQSLLIAIKKNQELIKLEREKLEAQEFLLKEREKKVLKLEKSVEGIVERESLLSDAEKNLQEERIFIAKQKALLEEKQASQEVIDEQLRVREDRLKRIHS